MKITGLSKSAVMEAAQRAFLGKSLELEEGSLFLRGVEPGAWRCEGIADIQHVSTCMGYHEEIINGNRTRVKTMIPLLFVKESRYAVSSFSKSSFNGSRLSDGSSTMGGAMRIMDALAVLVVLILSISFFKLS